MRAVVATRNWPVDPGTRSGSSIRLGYWLRVLSRLGAESIRLVHFMPQKAMDAVGDWNAASRQQSEHWGVEVQLRAIPILERDKTFNNYYVAGIVDVHEQVPHFRFTGADQADEIGRLAADADLFLSCNLAPLLALRRSGVRPVKVVLDFDDPDHLAQWRRIAAPPVLAGKLLHVLQAPALLLAARAAMRFADLTLALSRHDQAQLRRLGAGTPALAPVGTTMTAAPPGLVAEPNLLFLGGFNYPPNVEAAQRMVTRIFPLIRREVPQARLIVAGREPEAIPAAAAGADAVEFTGYIPELDALYARTRVVVCPLLTGTGVRLKLIEAAGQARPMVSTRLGAEGLEFHNGREILLHDADEAFAAACVRLLRDDAACLGLGAAARASALRHYGEEASVARLETLLRSVLAR